MLKTRNMGLRLLCLALALVCFIGAARPTAATATTEEKQQSLTTNVHYRAYSSAPVIGQMEDGTEVTVVDETREFYKVDCYDMNGYIAKSQIVHTEDGKYIVSCVAGSAETAQVEYTDHAQALQLRHSLLTLAQKQLGCAPDRQGRKHQGHGKSRQTHPHQRFHPGIVGMDQGPASAG